MEQKKHTSENYQQPQVEGEQQTVVTDPAVTSETDELDPSFGQTDISLEQKNKKHEDTAETTQ